MGKKSNRVSLSKLDTAPSCQRTLYTKLSSLSSINEKNHDRSSQKSKVRSLNSKIKKINARKQTENDI